MPCIMCLCVCMYPLRRYDVSVYRCCVIAIKDVGDSSVLFVRVADI